MKPIQHKNKQNAFYWLRSVFPVVLILMLFLVLSSCGFPGVKAGSPPVGKNNASCTPLVLAHRGYVTIDAGLDISSSYPRSVFEQAKLKLVAAIDSLVRPNSDGATVFVNYITSNSYTPDASPLTVVIPPLPADPLPPHLLPVPALSGDPYVDAKNKREVEAANQQAIASCNNAVAANAALVSSVRREVLAQTNKLRRLEPAVDFVSTDIYGFVERAAARLRGLPGSKYVVLATDLQNTNWSQDVGGWSLSGVHVLVIYHYCDNAPFCAFVDSSWIAVFKQTHALDWHFYDPSQSQALSLSFS